MLAKKRSLGRAVVTAAALMTTAAVVAACSSSGGSAAGGGSSQSGAPIKILTFGEITGLGPEPMPQAQDGVEAAVDAFNAAGGVQGRKVQLITCNTKLVPAVEEGCVAKAAAEGVVAAIPSQEILDNITTPLLEQQGIPILGDNPSTATAQYSTTSACFISGPFVLAPQAASQLASEGAKSVSVMSPTGVANVNVQNQAISMAASLSGSKVQNFVSVAPTATDFSSIAAQATGSAEDGTFVSALPPGLFSILGDVVQARPGIKIAAPGYLVISQSTLAALTKVPAAKGMYVNNYTAFPTDTSVPGIKLFQQQIVKVSSADLGNEQALFGWLDGWGAMQILKTITSGPIDSATILGAMKTATVSFDGVAPDWHYQYNTLGLGCVVNNQVYQGIYQGGTTITPLNGDKPVTGIGPQIIALYKKAFASYAH